MRWILFLFVCFSGLSQLQGALIVNSTIVLSPTNGPTTHLRFSQSPTKSLEKNFLELSCQGRLAVLGKSVNEQNSIFHNSKQDIIGFNIRKAISDYDSYIVFLREGKIEVIPNVGDKAFRLYAAKFGRKMDSSTVITSVANRTINFTHVDKGNPNGTWISFSVEIKPNGSIKLR